MAKQDVLFLRPGQKISVGSTAFNVKAVSKERWTDDEGAKRVWVSVTTKSGSGTNIPFKITDKVEVH